MERSIRIGKDFNVRWSIKKVVDGERQPYELGGKELVLQYRTPYGLKEATEWKTEGNTIVWTFRGKEQKALGSYELILTENGGKDGMVTVDTCRAFKLVAHSCEETEGSGSDIVIEDVVLESEVAFAALRGPQGEQGPAGPQGPQGERGPEGPQGPAGPSYNDTEIKAKLTELSAEIGGVQKEYTYEALTENGYVQAGGYVSEGGTTYIHSPYIPINVGAKITCTCNISPSVSCIALYGVDKTWKRSIVGTNKLFTQSIVVEDGEAYMIMTSLVVNKEEYKVVVSASGIKGDLAYLGVEQDKLGKEVGEIKDVADSSLHPTTKVRSHNVYNPQKAGVGYYYRYNDGARVERSDITTTDLIPCKSGDVVYVFVGTSYYGGNVTCWDKDGNFLEGFNATTSPYTIPTNDNIAYFRTSFYTWSKESLCININEKYEADTYKEEEAYYAELPIYAPNLNTKKQAGIAKYYTMTRDSVTSIYGRNNDYNTSFIFSIIAKKNYEDAAILPRLKGTSDTSELGDNNCTTVLAYAKKNQYQHIINAGIFLVADNTADGITIMNGNILKDGICEQFNVEQYVLGIKANGEMKSYRGMTAQQILDDGCIDAVTGFVPLFENSEAVGNDILAICPHYNVKHPRQIVGILSTGDFFTFCCDGRTDGEEGMTLKECINTLSELASVKYAFNLDGGGSTQTATYHKEINRRLDGRKVPNVIAFVV